MKAIIKIVSVLLMISSFIIISCSNQEESAKGVITLSENIVVVDYAVEGMVCAFGCAKTIQDELANMDGISSCEVSFEEGKVHIAFDKTQLSEKEIIAKIEGLAKNQYNVNKWVDKDDNLEESGKGEKAIGNVVLPTIEIPNLFRFLIDQL